LYLLIVVVHTLRMAEHTTVAKAYEDTKEVGALTGRTSFEHAKSYNTSEKTIVQQALSGLESYRLFRPVRHRFQRRRIIAQFPFQYLTADLADMAKLKYTNSHYTFLLVTVDIFTKMCYLKPLKNKSGPVVAQALREIFTPLDIKPNETHFWVDKGKEFYNQNVKSVMKDFGIQMYSTESAIKASVSENKIRQIKRIFERIYFVTKKNAWLPFVETVQNSLNNMYHSAIKMRPVEAASHRSEVFNNLYSDLALMKHKKPAFNVGDRVLLAREKGIFEKGYRKAYYQRPFVVIKVKDTLPVPTFVLENLSGEEHPGSFYAEQLQNVPHNGVGE
jgi:hypothetical protein